MNCTNKPTGANYDHLAADSPICKYTCENTYLNEDMPAECISNLLEYSVERGGYLAFDVIVAMILALILLGIVRMFHTLYRMNRKKKKQRIHVHRSRHNRRSVGTY